MKETFNSLRRRTELKKTLKIIGIIASVGKMRRGLRWYFSSPNIVLIPTSTSVKPQLGLLVAQYPSLLFCKKT